MPAAETARLCAYVTQFRVSFTYRISESTIVLTHKLLYGFVSVCNLGTSCIQPMLSIIMGSLS